VGDSRKAAIQATLQSQQALLSPRAEATADLVMEGPGGDAVLDAGFQTHRSIHHDDPLFPERNGGNVAAQQRAAHVNAMNAANGLGFIGDNTGGLGASSGGLPNMQVSQFERNGLNGLPGLKHGIPDMSMNMGDDDTPRPANIDAFMDRYDDFKRPPPLGLGAMGNDSDGGQLQSPHERRDDINLAKPQSPRFRQHKSIGRLQRENSLRSQSNSGQMDEDLDREGRIVEIDCGGKVFKTFLKTLHKHPGTLLYDMSQPGGALYQDGYIFLDRDEFSLWAILNFYRTDRLIRPEIVPDEMWHMELVFYKIENPVFKIPTAEDIDNQQLSLGKPEEEGVRRAIWMLWEDPGSSGPAKFLSMFSIFIICLGVAAFITETHPTIRDPYLKQTWFGLDPGHLRGGFKIIEILVVCFFTVELGMRFAVTTRKVLFVQRIINWIDLVAVVPFYVGLVPTVPANSSGTFVRVLRLARVFRILGLVFKLGKYSHGVRVLAQTFRTCLQELSVLMVLLVMAVIVISSGMYFCENPDLTNIEGKFTSISRSMYFSMISVTTIGYGDMTPLTMCGEIVACLAGLSGIFVLGLPISIIGVKFQQRYDEMLREAKIQVERDRLLAIDKKLQAMRGMRLISTKILGDRPPDAGDLTAEEIDKIERTATKVFYEVDLDNSGEIEIEELGEAMKKLGMEMDRDVLLIILNGMDEDNSGTVDKDEFLNFVIKCMLGDIPTTKDLGLDKKENSTTGDMDRPKSIRKA